MHRALRWAPLAVYVAAPSILILPILFSGKMLYGHDVVSVFQSQRIVIADAFRHGRLPVWDPHVMAGFPLLAGVQGAIFYPPTWLCVFLSAGTFWTLSAWMHLILAGVFAHQWLERGLGVSRGSALVGAFIYMLSGYLLAHLYAGHVTYVWAYPWMAALLWRLERFLAGPTLKRGVLLAVVLALLFLAGLPQFVFFAALLILARGLLYVFGSREGRAERVKVAKLGAAWLALGLLFTAPQLFPTLELITQMQRGTEDPKTRILFSMSPKELLNLLVTPRVPELDAQGADLYLFWETFAFVGTATLLLIGAAFAGKHPQRHFWAGVGLIGILLAMGIHTPLYSAFVFVMPGAELFRGPGRYLMLFTLAAVALAALGFEWLWNRNRPAFRISAAVLALAAAAQVTWIASGLITSGPQNHYRSLDQVAVAFKDKVGLEGRVAPRGTTIAVAGKLQEAGVDQVCGYEPMMLRRFAELLNAARGAPIEADLVVLASVAPHRIFDMLGVRYYLGPSGGYEENHQALPRAWVVNNAVVLETKELRLEQLAKGSWDPGRTVIFESYPDEGPPATTTMIPGRARVLSKKPGEYVLEAESVGDSYLVLSEAYYPGWSAEVDGKSVDVVPANHLIQAIRLPPGKHEVRFAYRSRFLGVGFVVALLAALVPVGILVRRRRSRQLALQGLPGAP